MYSASPVLVAKVTVFPLVPVFVSIAAPLPPQYSLYVRVCFGLSLSYALARIVMLVVVLLEQFVVRLYGGVFATGVEAVVFPSVVFVFPALSFTVTLRLYDLPSANPV